VTQLIDSPRVRILKTEHDNLIQEDASDMVWSVLGTAVHNMFGQHQPDGHIVEERLFAEVDNWVISGAVDLQRSEEDGTVTLLDYKCTSVWSVIYGKKEWDRQLNFYAWLVEQNGETKVSALSIVAVLRDWQRNRSGEKNYPQAPIVIVDIPLWSRQDRDSYVRERVRLHDEAEFLRLTGEPLPLCSDDERWKKPDTFAVKKEGNKRALRVLDSMQHAEEYMGEKEGLAIEVREGRYTRCEDNWCRVAEWCDQWRSG